MTTPRLPSRATASTSSSTAAVTALYVLDAAGARVRRIVSAGIGPGELFNPLALALNGDDLIAVADSPNGLDRVQYFASNGLRVGGFYLPLTPRAATDSVERAHRERRFPRLLGLDVRGQSAGVGRARDRTRRHGPGRSSDGQSPAGWHVTRSRSRHRDEHRDPASCTATAASCSCSRPVCRCSASTAATAGSSSSAISKDRSSTLASWRFPRSGHRGRRATSPSFRRWCARQRVDAEGRLWISLTVPYTYVYDAAGDKIRTVQFRGVRVLSPSSLYFTSTGRLLVGPGGYEFEVK